MDEHCYFAKEPPSIEIRGGMVFLRPAGSHCEIVFTPNTLQKFVSQCNLVLGEWRAGRQPVAQLERQEGHH